MNREYFLYREDKEQYSYYSDVDLCSINHDTANWLSMNNTDRADTLAYANDNNTTNINESV